MASFDQSGFTYYGRQDINQRGQSNAGMGPLPPQQPMLTPLQRQQMYAEQQGQLEQQRLQQIQQQNQNAPPPVNYVDSWQMTPEKVAAYRAAKQGGTSMQQPMGISNGQLGGQQAIANLLRMLGLA